MENIFKYRLIPVIVFCFFSMYVLRIQAQGKDIIYIQSVTAKVYSEKKLGSESLGLVKRGQAFQVIAREGDWYNIKFNNKSAWISKLFVSSFKPVGVADISNIEKISPEKLSRKRSYNYSTSAATRGISVSERGRSHDEKFRTNTQALEKIENQPVNPIELKKFEDEGNLNKD